VNSEQVGLAEAGERLCRPLGAHSTTAVPEQRRVGTVPRQGGTSRPAEVVEQSA